MKQQQHPIETIGTSQVERALVLSGGGPVGYAWMAGLVAHDVDLGRAELIVGTSAGSIVGAQLALGMDVATLVAETNRHSELNIYSSAGTGLGNQLVEWINAARA